MSYKTISDNVLITVVKEIKAFGRWVNFKSKFHKLEATYQFSVLTRVLLSPERPDTPEGI